MKEQVKDMYEQITMPEETVKKIRLAMAEKQKPRNTIGRILGRAAAALAAMVVLVFAISPQARAAASELMRKVIVFEDTGITVYEETDGEGNVNRAVSVDTEAPAFAQVREGRLYFLANGENLDITDQIGEDKPYYYTYADDNGYIHYLAVGYSGSLENYGIYEFIREQKEGQQEWEGWSSGTGRNFLNPETGTRYPWVELVWEEMDVPWPMPGE